MTLRSVAEVRLIDLPRHARDDGELIVIEEGSALPFPVLRMFTVRAAAGATRGRHAHRRCAQLFVCVHGAIDVECDDGSSKAHFTLDTGDKALLVPPSIWATETTRDAGSVLAVLCDRRYEADDYIRDYEQFLAFRRGS